jgi:thioredoxin-dependent peroxiredoxin
LARLDTAVVGISTDTIDAQKQFMEKNKLNFPLYSDKGGKVAEAFGVLMPNKFAKRASFVIDRQGKLAKIYPSVAKAGDHPQEVLEFVEKNLAKK